MSETTVLTLTSLRISIFTDKSAEQSNLRKPARAGRAYIARHQARCMAEEAADSDIKQKTSIFFKMDVLILYLINSYCHKGLAGQLNSDFALEGALVFNGHVPCINNVNGIFVFVIVIIFFKAGL